MEKDNMSAADEILQRSIGKRELRYGLMRLGRSFFGWPVWVAGFIMFGYGFVRMCFEFLFATDAPGGLTASSLILPASMMLFAVAGFVAIMTGLSIFGPYQYDTFMPGVESERRCLRCGYSLEPAEVFPACGGCGKPLPLDFNTYLGRILSKIATVMNILMMILAGVVFVIR